MTIATPRLSAVLMVPLAVCDRAGGGARALGFLFFLFVAAVLVGMLWLLVHLADPPRGPVWLTWAGTAVVGAVLLLASDLIADDMGPGWTALAVAAICAAGGAVIGVRRRAHRILHTVVGAVGSMSPIVLLYIGAFGLLAVTGGCLD
jgi:hypothetical protein